MKDQFLPNNLFPVPIHVHHMPSDSFQADVSCPVIGLETKKRRKSNETNNLLLSKHNQTIRQMAHLMGQNPDTFSAVDAAQYLDTFWARYFDQIFDMG